MRVGRGRSGRAGGAGTQARATLLATALVAATVATAGAAGAQDDDRAWTTDVDRRVLEQLTAVASSGSIVVHHRPGDLDPETLAEDLAANVAAFEELSRKLDMAYAGKVHVFLYRDGEDMLATTGSGSDIAFSTGTASVHQVHDFRGVHELTHIFALQFPEVEDGGGPDLFTTEGLATAMAGSDQGVPVHDWAAVYLAAARLPELAGLRGGFPEGAASGVHPYHVAGSFVLYLVERFGIERVKTFYMNSAEAGMVFGVTAARLERDWRAMLEAREVAPEHEAHVLDALGLGKDPLPEAWATAAGTPLFDGGTLDALVLDDPACWTLQGGLLIGTHDGPWTSLHSRAEFPADVGLRVRFRLLAGDAVQLRLNRVPGHESQAILAVWSAFLSVGDEGDFTGNDSVKLPHGTWCTAVFVNQGGHGRLWLNGSPVLDAEGALASRAGAVGFAVERGTVEVSEITAFVP